MPAISPVVVLKLKPVGNAGLIAYVLYVPDPPVTVTELNGVISLACTNVLVGFLAVITKGGSITVSVKLLLSVCPTESTAVTVKLAVVNSLVGIPFIVLLA